MSNHPIRPLISVAALSWLAVGGYGVWEVVTADSSDNWQTAYFIFAIGLLLGSLLTVVAVWRASRQSEHAWVRSIGLGICTLGVLSTVVAWALPLWMTLLGVGFGLVALAGSRSWRRPVAFLAVAQLLGMTTMYLGLAAELGPRDEYGDHPAAFGAGLAVTAVVTLVSLYQLDRSISPAAASIPVREQTAMS